MRHDKLSLQLDLILLLTENRRWTIEEMCENLGLQKRNIYYYLTFFKQAGFEVEKHGKYHSLSRRSPFISKLCDVVNFSEDEVGLIKKFLDTADERDIVVRSLRQKLLRFYDFNIISDPVRLKNEKKNLETLYEAIKMEQKVTIMGYSSPHSKSVSNRVVEPYLLFNGNRDVRAYEVATGINKTFRLSRMQSVEPSEAPWEHKDDHKEFFTDIFNFTSEQRIPVKVELDQLSYNVLIEEYPRAERDITPVNNYKWLYQTHVCSMLGIGRFVLGMFDHVRIIDSPELQSYVKTKLTSYLERANRLKK